MEMNEPLKPPAPPEPPPGTRTPADPASALERDLEKERQRADAAENLLRQQEAIRGEADRQLKAILEQLKREKAEREQEDERSHAQFRIDTLEERLDEMHHTWAGILKESLAKRDSAPPASPETNPGLAREIADAVERLGTSLTARIGESDRRLAMEMEKYEIRLGALAQERAALQAAVEEKNHRLRQELSKERIAEQEQTRAQLEEIRKSLNQIQSAREGGSQDTALLRELMDKLQTINRPEKAKDQIVLDLEQEKRDLMAALKSRNEQLHAYTEERREVERSMGESLMSLNREIEAERAKYQELNSQASDLRLQIQSRDAQLELARKSAEDAEARFRALSAERDDLAKAFMSELEKSKNRGESIVQTNLTWEKQLEEARSRLSQERGLRSEAESQIADLKAKLQSLTDHIARTIQSKEKMENESSSWMKEREELLGTLRKKDEMISMLSATFQNLLKK